MRPPGILTICRLLLIVLAIRWAELPPALAADHPTPFLPIANIARVAHFQMSGDGQTLVSAAGQHINLWDGASSRQIQTIRSESPVNKLALNTDGSLIAASTLKRYASIWNALTGTQVAKIETEFTVRAVGFFDLGTKLVIAGDKTVEVWDSSGQRRFRSVTLPNRVREIVIARNTGQLVVAARDEVLVFELETGELQTRREFPWSVTSLSISPNGQVVCASGSKTVAIWNLRRNAVVHCVSSCRIP